MKITSPQNKNKSRRRPLNTNMLIALVFFGLIILGTALLTLPVSSRDGKSCGVLTAVFTATSSTCVTGLALRDTWTQWSGFGQCVIITLIEIGGLGFMSMASFVIFGLKRRVSMSQQMVIAQSIGADDMNDAIRVQKRMLLGCVGAELAGALVLTIRFIGDYGFAKALKLGLFHSISAFCNAGFDIFGFETPGESMIPFNRDPAVMLTLSALIIIGGIGFLVWDEIFRIRSPKKWSVYTKLVLFTSAGLLLAGTALISLTEWCNPETMGEMSVPEKILAAFFQSVTSRTAGFDALGQGAMTEGGKAVTMFLMLIGGSSGSTAGGLKTVTFIVIVLFLISRMKGNGMVCAFGRMIPSSQVLNALTIFGVVTLLSFFGGAVICATSPISFTDGLFEAVSAIATVGLTTGITPSLSLAGKILMIVYMFFGRVGILTISLGFLREKPSAQKIKFADTNLLIG